MLTIDCLPDEVLEIIFSYLPLPARKRASLVSQYWLEVSHRECLAKDDIIIVRNLSDLDLCTTRRRNLKIRIENCADSPPPNVKFWKEYGSSVQSLELYRINMKGKVLCEILCACPNLERLLLSTRDIGGRESAPKERSDRHGDAAAVSPALKVKSFNLTRLSSLDLLYPGSMSTVDFARLVGSAHRLRRLGFFCGSWEFFDEPLCKAVKSLILRQASTWRELSFYDCRFLSKAVIEMIMKEIGPQLTGLYMYNTRYHKNEDFLQIPGHLPNLQSLDVGLNSCLTNDALTSVFGSLKCLKSISLRETDINDDGLAAIAGLSHLRSLDLTACNCLTAEGISKHLGQKDFLRMRDLRLSQISCVNDDVLTKVLPKMPNLKCLFLDFCHQISTQGFTDIVNNGKLLRCLSLAYFPCIKTLLKPVSIVTLKNLVHLNLQGCHHLLDAIVPSENLKFLELQSINLFQVPVSEEGLKTLFSNCPSIRRVNLPAGTTRPAYLSDLQFRHPNCLFSFDGLWAQSEFNRNIFGQYYAGR